MLVDQIGIHLFRGEMRLRPVSNSFPLSAKPTAFGGRIAAGQPWARCFLRYARIRIGVSDASVSAGRAEPTDAIVP